jgi:hypothetical protein
VTGERYGLVSLFDHSPTRLWLVESLLALETGVGAWL